MTAVEFIRNVYTHFNLKIMGDNPVVDFELHDLCKNLDDYAALKVKEALDKQDELLPLPEDIEAEAKIVLSSMHIARQNKLTREPGEWTDEELLNGLKLMYASCRQYV